MGDIDIPAMEIIIIEHTGPMGKFVIKKAIADIGLDPNNYGRESAIKLISLVLERAIFDKTKWESVKKQILTAWDM
ncbi:MAG: hypothetical protein KAS16_04400, partial [Thermoplasmata archaeon]|nr:hypothetical protein [Thermoplasmata archaeon]